MNNRDLPTYVTDTNALFWALKDPGRLSPAAYPVFRLAAVGEARIIVPAIVVAELYYLSQKRGDPILPSTFLADIARSQEFIFSELGQAQLERIEAMVSIPEMHDRLVVAEALVHHAPIISSDSVLRQSGVVPVIW